MLAALLLEPKIAFLLLAALIIGAAVPLAAAWARLLPEERPPFEIENPRRRSDVSTVSIYNDAPAMRRLDIGTIVLLALLTAAFALQFPGMHRSESLNSLPDHW